MPDATDTDTFEHPSRLLFLPPSSKSGLKKTFPGKGSAFTIPWAQVDEKLF